MLFSNWTMTELRQHRLADRSRSRTNFSTLSSHPYGSNPLCGTAPVSVLAYTPLGLRPV